jgi:hypothetical protein
LKTRAASESTSVKALIETAVFGLLSAERAPLPKRRKLPVIGSKASPKLNLSHDRVNEILADLS